MTILPDCEIQSLSECKAGKLIRLVGHRCNGEFGLVGDSDDGKGRVLVLFQEGPPVYLIDNNPSQIKVLVYNSDWVLEVDQRGPYEPAIQELYSKPGCIIREETRWLLNVQDANSQFRPYLAQYDFRSLQLVNVSREVDNIAIFGKWSLYLGDSDTPREERIKVAAFEWKPTRGRES